MAKYPERGTPSVDFGAQIADEGRRQDVAAYSGAAPSMIGA